MSDVRGRRAQTEGIAVVLLTAIVILGVGTFGAFYLQSVDDQASSERVPADLQVVATNDSGASETTIVVTHRGGETIDDGVVYLRDQDVSYVLEPNPFEAGHDNSTQLTGVSAQSKLRVLIVENTTGSVVFRSTVTVRGSGTDPGPVAPSDSTPPSVSLDRPTAGETLTAGSTYTVEWAASDSETSVTDIDIEYRPDDGSSWSTVVSGTANDGSYDWTVPNDDTSEARIRVTATDEGGNTASDQSGDFTIEPAAAPSVVSASLSNTPITRTEASSTQTLTIDFDEQMNQSVDPSIALSGLDADGNDYTVESEGWVDGDTYEQEITFQGNDKDLTSTIEVSGAEDVDGDTQEPNPATPNSFRYDTIVPGTANNVVISDAPINLGNQNAVDVAVTNPSTVVGDETVVVELEDETGAVVSGSAVISGGAGDTTVVTVDTSTLADGKIVPSTYLRDDVGQVGGTIQNDNDYQKDTDRPDVTSVTVEDAPIDDSDTGSPKTVTVFFDEAMDQTNDPTVEIAGLARTYTVTATNDGFQSGTKWTGTVTFEDDDEEATGTIKISATTDEAGNALPTNDSATVEVETESSGPFLTGVRVEDNTKNDNGQYDVSYDVDDTANFDRVEVTFDNRANEWADETLQSTDPRTVLSYTQGGVEGDTYDITLRVYDTNGDVTDTQTVTDVADGNNPSGNDDLSHPSSPIMTSTSVKDKSKPNRDRGEYQVGYKIDDPSGEFQRIEVVFENTDQSWATTTESSTKLNGNVKYKQGGVAGDRYEIVLRVIDDDGILVDRQVITDIADGTDP